LALILSNKWFVCLLDRDVRGDAAAAAAAVAAPQRKPVLIYHRGAARQGLNFWKLFGYFYRKNL